MRTKYKNQYLSKNITNYLKIRKITPVIICIGSDRVIGDCLGPLVGELLTNKYNVKCFVYGTLSTPITALNLISTINFIKNNHALQPIIAIDSCIGKIEEVGNIKVLPHGLFPGSASGKKLPLVGDISITANVSHSESLLSTLNLGFVYSLANNIASEVATSINELSSSLYNQYIVKI